MRVARAFTESAEARLPISVRSTVVSGTQQDLGGAACAGQVAGEQQLVAGLPFGGAGRAEQLQGGLGDRLTVRSADQLADRRVGAALLEQGNGLSGGHVHAGPFGIIGLDRAARGQQLLHRLVLSGAHGHPFGAARRGYASGGCC